MTFFKVICHHSFIHEPCIQQCCQTQAQIAEPPKNSVYIYSAPTIFTAILTDI